MRTLKIALDAMGGDHAPAVVIDGAVMAAREFGPSGVDIVLVGREADIQRELARHQTQGLPISTVNATQVVEMDEHTMAVREKKGSSMVVGVRMVKDGQAAAFVSAGNSGAIMAAALFGLGRIRGIDRPALGGIYPAAPTPCVLIDIGVNTDPKLENLVQNALMGSVYAERVMGIARPRVGLVSNGEEADKGSALVREAYKVLAASHLNFVGNVEGKDIGRGLADVVVADGFVGNVILKLSEGLVSFLARYLKRELSSGVRNVLAWVLMLPGLLLMLPGLLLMSPTFKRIARYVDYAEYGGSLLLGVNGVVVICHGRSNAKAIKNAVRLAAHSVKEGVLDSIKQGVADMQVNA